MPEKSKGERLRETITLLKKLPEVGVARESFPYSQVQDLMSQWVNGGPETKTIIDFESHTGTLILPVEQGKVSSLDLKAKKFS